MSFLSTYQLSDLILDTHMDSISTSQECTVLHELSFLPKLLQFQMLNRLGPEQVAIVVNNIAFSIFLPSDLLKYIEVDSDKRRPLIS